MTFIENGAGGGLGLWNRGAGERGRVGATIGVGGSDHVTKLQRFAEVSAADVHLLRVGEDQPVLDDRGCL